jgi:hypothetical protein
MIKYLASAPRFIAQILLLIFVLSVPTVAAPSPDQERVAPISPSVEFESPYAFRILSGGTVVEVSGSFSWAMPQNLVAVLAQAPRARTVWLESPGGLVKPALEIAGIIRARGLDTYVARFCASACTLAYLGGQRRSAAPAARLGFHQAHAPGIPPEAADPLMRHSYEKYGIPSGFIDHVLHTSPKSLWYPTHAELRGAGFINERPPPETVVVNDGANPAWREAIKLMPFAPEGALVQFASALSTLLDQLQAAGPEVCWHFMHQGPTDLRGYVSSETMDAIAAAATRVREDVSRAPVAALDSLERKRVLERFVGALKTNGQGSALGVLRPGGGEYTVFCPSLRVLLTAALAAPEDTRAPALRALLSGG